MKKKWFIPVAIALVLILLFTPGLVAAQEQRSGGKVVVERGETVGDLVASGGAVEVLGTVDGDLRAYGGSVTIRGEVTGDVVAYAGDVEINGEVGGNVSAFGGSVELGPGGSVGGWFQAGAGDVVIDGVVGGDADVAAGSLELRSGALVNGDLRHTAQSFEQEGDGRVLGTVSRVSEIQFREGMDFQGPEFPTGAFALYGFLVNLVLGAVLLYAFPGFTMKSALRFRGRALGSFGWGLFGLIGIPILLVLVMLTIVGIPLAIAGFGLYLLLIWIGSVLGGYGLGDWLLLRAGYAGNRWASLLVGLLVVALVGLVPVLGGLFGFVVTVMGIGAVGIGVREVTRF